MSLKAQLAKANKLWKDGLKMKPDFDSTVPDGTYVGRISKAQLGESESSGRLQVSWAAVISSGEYKGEKMPWWSGLKTEQNFMYLQRDIARLGFEVPNTIDGLADILEEIEKDKPSIRFRVKTDGEFTNIRILKKLDADEAPEDEDEEEETEEETDDAPEDVADEGAEAEEEDDEEEAEEAEEEEEDEEPTLDIGTRVAFDLKGKEVVGEVTKVAEDQSTATVRLDDDRKFKVKVESLRPAPKAKVKKKK